MIKVNIYRDKFKNIVKYSVEGHSGFAEKGRDIVCAAVSVLAQTTLISLNKVCGIDEKHMHYSIDDINGMLLVFLSNNLDKEKRIKANIVLESMETGLLAITEDYPEYVTLEYREV